MNDSSQNWKLIKEGCREGVQESQLQKGKSDIFAIFGQESSVRARKNEEETVLVADPKGERAERKGKKEIGAQSKCVKDVWKWNENECGI